MSTAQQETDEIKKNLKTTGSNIFKTIGNILLILLMVCLSPITKPLSIYMNYRKKKKNG